MATDYAQVELRRGETVDVVWISAEFATPSRFIKIKHDGTWQNDWKVERVYGILPARIVESRARDYTRIATYE